jgi:hypothetical protein
MLVHDGGDVPKLLLVSDHSPSCEFERRLRRSTESLNMVKGGMGER